MYSCDVVKKKQTSFFQGISKAGDSRGYITGRVKYIVYIGRYPLLCHECGYLLLLNAVPRTETKRIAATAVLLYLLVTTNAWL